MDDSTTDCPYSRRLTFDPENFDGYVVTLLSKLRVHPVVDNLLSGELKNSLEKFQSDNSASLQTLNIPFFPPVSLLSSPTETYQNFLRYTMLRRPSPVPELGDLNTLQDEFMPTVRLRALSSRR